MAKHIYESPQFPPYKIGSQTTDTDHARLLGLHSLYYLCQMVSRCPLVSLFSGRPLDPEHSREKSRVHAEIARNQAISHSQLIRDYLSRGRDISKLSPLVGFASFVAASIFTTLLRSAARRRQITEQRPMQISKQLLGPIHDVLDILSSLQAFWEPLKPMVCTAIRSIKTCPRTPLSTLSSCHAKII
jgi:hypothetical protein